MIPFARVLNYGNTAPLPVGIKKVVAQEENIFVLYSDGNLYCRGRNASGQLGTGGTAIVNTWFLTHTNVSDCWATNKCTLISLNDGGMYFAGVGTPVGRDGFFFNWTSWDTQVTWLLNNTGSTIKSVAAGYEWISVLMNNNTLWNIGTANGGQFSTGTSGTITQLNTFIKSTLPASVVVKELIPTYYTNAFLSDNGALYVCGNIYASSITQSNTFISSASNVQYGYNKQYTSTVSGSVVSGTGSSSSTGGTVLLYGGDGGDGALGNGSSASGNVLYTKMPTPPGGDVYSVNYGSPYKSTHVVTSTGVYGTGWNTTPYAGRLGIGSASSVNSYKLCQFPNALQYEQVKVYGTIQRTYVCDGYKIYSAGDNTTYGGISSRVFVDDSPI